MHGHRSIPEFRLRAVRLWLLAAAAMIFLTLIVGGATRLTVSGLSIVEWKPVTGVLPPLSEPAWQAEFDAYKAIPQYRELNKGMNLAQFKTIYFWEWTHRLLARATGAVFLLPFLLFLWQGAIPPPLRARLWIIFAGGAALGVVGWWMVSSGLIRHAHQGLAIPPGVPHDAGLRDLCRHPVDRATDCPASTGQAPRRLRLGALAIAALLLVQIYLGALVAGLDGGLKYNTWPLIDGAVMPPLDQILFIKPLWRNLFENILTVQINHRMLADGIWLLAMLHAFDAWRMQRGVRGAFALAGAVTLQAALGIVTLLYQAPLPLALAHQVMALIVFSIAIVHAERLSHRAIARVPQAVGQAA